MENKLEELLNSFIEKGWKPFGIEYPIHIHYYEFNDVSLYRIQPTIGGGETLGLRICRTLRDISSVDSGLWQFVCENGMIDGVDRWTLNARQKSIYDKFITSEKEYTPKMNYEYRLIEASLKDESELEDFLLNSIKLD